MFFYICFFTSYARGDYDQESDIDVVGIVDDERNSLRCSEKKVWDLVHDIDREYDYDIPKWALPTTQFQQRVFLEVLNL
ncbi:hypothetical protein FACS189465_0200 [Clostridia bacterium]|nr:hypothetical protein FACS189465_0200 [Clostridia bacterium]